MMESSQGIAPCLQRFADVPVHLLGRRTKMESCIGVAPICAVLRTAAWLLGQQDVGAPVQARPDDFLFTKQVL